MILVISSEQDLHAKNVLECLAREGAQATLLDLSQFPQRLQLSMNYNQVVGHDHRILTVGNGDLVLSSYKVIWWRRSQPFEPHPDIADPAHRSFAHNESYEAFSGLWLALDVFWINHPTRNQEAAYKPYQLKVAQEVGLEIPPTLITNNPDKAREFVNIYGPDKTIYKSFSATPQNWRETRLLKPEEVELFDSVKFAPVIFQEFIPAQVDLRVTIVGKNVFSAAIYSQETSYKMDYRMDMDAARVEPFELPRDVVERLNALMDRLSLVYGAIDMRLTPDGRYIFLEINPAGQWLFIQERTKQPITENFTHLLTHCDR